MRFVIFCHSIISDWNHGNAHFLRGITRELIRRGHDVEILEPENGWSVRNLLAAHGGDAVRGFYATYPEISLQSYALDAFDPHESLQDADVVLVHEWTDPAIVRQIGEHRTRRGGYVLLFHDTHHRALSEPDAPAQCELTKYDGVLAYGRCLTEIYLARGWARRAWTWHEAADTTVFFPRTPLPEGDLVWIGNWGDDERTNELEEFLIRPVEELRLRTAVYGVRYPEHARRRLARAGIEYCGWLPNYRVPEIFARFRATIHVPRRPYATALPGIPTIRPFEAMACGIPFVTSPWEDREQLFTPGRDFLVARDGAEMKGHLQRLLGGNGRGAELASNGLATIRARHTCAHRVTELLGIVESIRKGTRSMKSRPTISMVAGRTASRTVFPSRQP